MILITITAILAMLIYVPMEATDTSNEQAIIEDINNNNILENDQAKEDEWIVKWTEDYQTEFLDQVYLLDWVPEQKVMKVKLKEETDLQKWLDEWQDNPKIEYIQPNYKYKISQRPNDAYYSKQNYLQQIDAESGWDQIKNTDITIAILDTGVDLAHPDIKPNLVPGINLLDKDKLPQDDNGHGTNLAGIVGAVGDNIMGISGVTWKSKIMPVKVLDENGVGEPFYIGQGIRYAVDNGAKIILLSLGVSVYSPFMKEAIDYAESKDVLIVAATGNNGSRLNYPSEFSNVLSVGGVDSNDKYVTYSNYGYQLDVVAPSEGIYTTKLGGEYTINSGTSMAAPQVAGLAALLFQKYPDMSPKEVTNLIKFTADDVETPGWDIRTGYGRINVAKALTTSRSVLEDGYEPNQTAQTATQFPTEDILNAKLTKNDVDWYKIDAPYDGKLNITLKLDRMLEHGVHIELIDGKEINPKASVIDELSTFNNIAIRDAASTTVNDGAATTEVVRTNTYDVKKDQTISIDVKKGTTYIKISYLPEQLKTGINNINYSLTNSFTLYGDAYEPNDEPWDAYYINNLNKEIKGTFNKDNDHDWYKVRTNDSGILSVTINVESNRLDPVISIQPSDDRSQTFDYQSEGKEEFGYMHITPGDYYIRVSDYNMYGSFGEYSMSLRFKSTDGDVNEPNDLSTQAIELELTDRIFSSKIIDAKDYDWFSFTLDEEAVIAIDFAAENMTDVTMYNNDLEVIWSENSLNWVKGEIFQPGNYFIRLGSPIVDTDYSLSVKKMKLYGNFIDINEHWAKASIIALNNEGIITGYEDYTFRPNEQVTRENVALALSKALTLPDNTQASFVDVNGDNEHTQAIAKVYNAGIMDSYEDYFRPEQAVSREELVIILSKAFEIPVQYDLPAAYQDVSNDNIAYNEINTFKMHGWEIGLKEELFWPSKIVTRAEFAGILDRLIEYSKLNTPSQ